MTFDILAFCRKRGIDTENLRITQSVDWHVKETSGSRIVYKVEVPKDFPDKYRKALSAAARTCLAAQLARGMDKDSLKAEITVAD